MINQQSIYNAQPVNHRSSDNGPMSIELGKRIKAAREAKGWDQVELGRKFGVTKSAVNQWESGKNVPDQRKQSRLAQLLDLDPEMVRALAAGEIPGRSGMSDQPALFDAPPQSPPPRVVPPPSPQIQFDRPDIPVWASAAAGDGEADAEGAMIITAEPIDYIRRSERTANVPNPWAFHVVGNSMLERLAQGDQVIINPAMPLLPGADCVFIHQAADGIMYALVKRLLRASGDVWRVRQLNPEQDFQLSRRKWSKAYRIAEIRPRM